MTSKSTPDERFLKKLYDLTKGDTEKELDYVKVAALIGLKETAAKNIVKALAQGNFLKKTGDKTVCLTSRGKNFVEER